MSRFAAVALGVVVALTGAAIVAVAFLAKPEGFQRRADERVRLVDR